MLHISEFRVQKYADKGGFPHSLRTCIGLALRALVKIQDNE